MSTTSPISPPGRRPGRIVGEVMLLLFGSLLDVYGLINVPGAAEFADGRVEATTLVVPLFLVVIATWAALLYARRRPMWILVAGGVLLLIGTSYLLFLVGAVRLALARPEWIRRLAVVVGAALLGFALREALSPWGAALPWAWDSDPAAQDQPGWRIGAVVIAGVSYAVAAIVVLGARSRRAVDEHRRVAEHEHLRADILSEQLVRQAERERIARDIHDTVAHRLSAVSLRAGELEEAATSDPHAAEIARRVREQSHAAILEMRGMIRDLRSPGAATQSMSLREIGRLLASTRAAGASLRPYVLIEDADRAAPALQETVYRVVQESVTNGLKHAGGGDVDVYLTASAAEGVRIRVSNAIPPVASSVPGGRHGTSGIRERVAVLNGTAWIGRTMLPASGESFLVDVTLPWMEREPGQSGVVGDRP